MDVAHPLLSLCPGSHGRVLDVLATADEPLTRRQIAHRRGVSPRAVAHAIEHLATAGVVWRAKVTPYWHWPRPLPVNTWPPSTSSPSPAAWPTAPPPGPRRRPPWRCAPPAPATRMATAPA